MIPVITAFWLCGSVLAHVLLATPTTGYVGGAGGAGVGSGFCGHAFGVGMGVGFVEQSLDSLFHKQHLPFRLVPLSHDGCNLKSPIPLSSHPPLSQKGGFSWHCEHPACLQLVFHIHSDVGVCPGVGVCPCASQFDWLCLFSIHISYVELIALQRLLLLSHVQASGFLSQDGCNLNSAISFNSHPPVRDVQVGYHTTISLLSK